MTFVGYLYDKLSWTTGSLNGGDQRGLGGDPAKVISLVYRIRLKIVNFVLPHLITIISKLGWF